MAETFPESIGKYKIEGILAKGGMGVVYRSTHPTLNKPVIIKKLTARKNSTNIKRFVQEGRRVMLRPENADYSPIKLSTDDFESGSARILGVASEVKIVL